MAGIKRCFVPSCTNNSFKNSNKKFVTIPTNKSIRKRWYESIGNDNVLKGHDCYCCEDHFDWEQDARNWLQWKLMPEKTKLFLRTDVVPHKNLGTPLCNVTVEPGFNVSVLESHKAIKEEFVEEECTNLIIKDENLDLQDSIDKDTRRKIVIESWKSALDNFYYMDDASFEKFEVDFNSFLNKNNKILLQEFPEIKVEKETYLPNKKQKR